MERGLWFVHEVKAGAGEDLSKQRQVALTVGEIARVLLRVAGHDGPERAHVLQKPERRARVVIASCRGLLAGRSPRSAIDSIRVDLPRTLLNDGVVNRTDDHLGPLKPSADTRPSRQREDGSASHTTKRSDTA
jgi:hypothetical protein